LREVVTGELLPASDRQHLLTTLACLRHLGAAEAILFVDHDEPGGVRVRPVAVALYARVGFTLVDHLWSYERS